MSREGAVSPNYICRCEELTRVEIERAIDDGARTINDVKRRTRAGMGACQGAYCLHIIATVLHDRRGTPLEHIAPMTSRPPVRWISLAALAGDQPAD
jgi:NAD(P)H-nitrite reductase large subunit